MQCSILFYVILLLACVNCGVDAASSQITGIIDRVWTWRMTPELIDPAKWNATTTPIVYQTAAVVAGMSYYKLTLTQSLLAGFLVFGLKHLTYQLVGVIILAAFLHKEKKTSFKKLLSFIGSLSNITSHTFCSLFKISLFSWLSKYIFIQLFIKISYSYCFF